MNENSEESFIRIAILGNEIEAQLIGSILKEQSIPHRIRSYHDTAYDGLFQFQKGWGEIRSTISHKQEILDIIDSVKASVERKESKS